MRTAILAISLSSLCLVAAWAEDDPMAGRYGNTTISTAADGTQTKTYYSKDHTFSIKKPGYSSDGTWEIKDGKLCRTYKTPPAGITNPECVSADARKVGDTWTRNGSTVTLVQGIQ